MAFDLKSAISSAKGGKKKKQAPKKKQFSMKELQRLTELLKKMQNANPQEINDAQENMDQLAGVSQDKNEDNSEIPKPLRGNTNYQ